MVLINPGQYLSGTRLLATGACFSMVEEERWDQLFIRRLISSAFVTSCSRDMPEMSVRSASLFKFFIF